MMDEDTKMNTYRGTPSQGIHPMNEALQNSLQSAPTDRGRGRGRSTFRARGSAKKSHNVWACRWRSCPPPRRSDSPDRPALTAARRAKEMRAAPQIGPTAG